jgi:hypothetical protein
VTFLIGAALGVDVCDFLFPRDVGRVQVYLV